MGYIRYLSASRYQPPLRHRKTPKALQATHGSIMAVNCRRSRPRVGKCFCRASSTRQQGRAKADEGRYHLLVSKLLLLFRLSNVPERRKHHHLLLLAYRSIHLSKSLPIPDRWESRRGIPCATSRNRVCTSCRDVSNRPYRMDCSKYR